MSADGDVAASKDGPWFVYVILCEGESFYIGATNDIKRRYEEHVAGTGADWTRTHKPVRIIHHERYAVQTEAFDREKKLKTGFGRKWLKREFKAGRLKEPF